MADASRDDILRKVMGAHDQLVAQAYVATRDWGLAEEFVQEAVLFAVDNWEQVYDIEGTIPWIRKVVRLKTFEGLRRSRKHQGADIDLAEALVDAAFTEQPQEDYQGRVHALQDCLDQVGGNHRSVLEGFYWKGRSCEEMAEESGRQPAALRQILSRLRRKLKTCIEGKMEIQT